MVVEQMNELIIMWNGCLFRVSSLFGVPHGRTSCTPHATKGKCVLLGGAMSSSMLWGDSEIGCLLEELDNDTIDDDERVFLLKTLAAIFHIVAALTHKYTGGCLC
jgi:hypothetical protein